MAIKFVCVCVSPEHKFHLRREEENIYIYIWVNYRYGKANRRSTKVNHRLAKANRRYPIGCFLAQDGVCMGLHRHSSEAGGIRVGLLAA